MLSAKDQRTRASGVAHEVIQQLLEAGISFKCVAGSDRCRILSNTSGVTLNLREIGVNGTVVGSCAAAIGGTCDTPTLGHARNLKFMCTVSSANG